MALPALQALLREFRVLIVLAPHPDDEVLGCFGLIRAAQRLGLRVEVHIVTDGERCFGALPADEECALRAARQHESLQAAALLGYASPTFWSLGDSQLMAQEALMERALQNHCSADALGVAPWWLDGHPDHEMVAHSLRKFADVRRCIFYPVWALIDRVRRAQFLGQQGVTAMALAPAERALKQRAAALFQTQFSRDQTPAGAILRDEFLAEFTTDHEYYLHGA